MSKYINPFFDFSFKYIFSHEELLISLLNSIFEKEPGFKPIVKVEYKDKEMTKRKRDNRGVIYDIHCTCNDEHKFIVEMQAGEQAFFIDRTVYYVSRAIVEQGKAGKDWDYMYLPVFLVSFMNFVPEGFDSKVKTDAMLCDRQTHKPISDKIRLIYIQLPEFNIDDPSKCVTKLEQWVYTLKNMEHLEVLPFAYPGSVFERLSEIAEYANLTPEQQYEYDTNLQGYRDYMNTIEFAERKGRAEGEAKGRAEGRADAFEEIARAMVNQGIPLDKISDITGISKEKIAKL